MIISIITICLNDLVGLKKTRDSVISQQSFQYEHIIVDGGSKDGTYEYLKSQNDQKLVWISETDYGRSDAFNKGIQLSRGDLIICLNAGDIFINSNVIGEVISDWEDKPVDVMSYGVKCSDGHIMRCINEEYWARGLHAHQGLFVSKDVYRKIGGYNLFLTNRMDYDFFIRIAKYGFSHRLIDRVVAVFDLNGVSSYNQDNARLEGIALQLMYYKEVKQTDYVYLGEYLSQKNNSTKPNVADDISMKYTLLRNWMIKKMEGKHIANYLLDNGIGRVSIYGAGQLGGLLLNELENTEVYIADLMDSNTDKEIEGYKAIPPSNCSRDIDAIIVTVVKDDEEIVVKLEELVKTDVITLRNIITEL